MIIINNINSNNEKIFRECIKLLPKLPVAKRMEFIGLTAPMITVHGYVHESVSDVERNKAINAINNFGKRSN